MPTLEIITIGTELLLGEIQDTNSTYIARTLRDHGIDIYRFTTIGDNPARISSAIKEALDRAEIVITTGGLGPTVDDPTRQAVADATDRELIFLQPLWDQILERFEAHGRKPTDNNRRQAYIPQGAIPIHNPEGTAPCFIVEVGDARVVASLPGVPSEMKLILHQSIIPFLDRKFDLKSQVIKAFVLHVASLGESAIDEIIGDLEQRANPTVGLLAHPGQVDIRVTVKANSEEDAQSLAEPVVVELYRRLGDYIYGEDEATLESVIAEHLNQHRRKLSVVETGLEGFFSERLQSGQPDQFVSQSLTAAPDEAQTLQRLVSDFRNETDSAVGFGAALTVNDTVTAEFVYQDAHSTEILTRQYGGPQDHAILWAQNAGLDFLRKQLISSLTRDPTGAS